MAKYNVLVQATDNGWVGSVEGDLTVWGATVPELFDNIKATLEMDDEDDLRLHQLVGGRDSRATSN